MRVLATFVCVLLMQSVALATGGLPRQLVFKNGTVLREVEYLKWATDHVVVKCHSGVAPVRFVNLAPQYRKALQAHAVRHARFEELIPQKKIAAGMTRDQVTRSWGPPQRKVTTGGKEGTTDQWFYPVQIVYFVNGEVTSWQTTEEGSGQSGP